MTYFEWDPALETGHLAIDAQHKALFALANELQQAVDSQDHDDEAVANAVYGLCGYVVEHFRDEEELMVQYRYPGLGPHRALHEQLSGATLDIMARFVNGEALAPSQLAPLVCDWLKGHIMQHDLALVRFVEHADAMARHAA